MTNEEAVTAAAVIERALLNPPTQMHMVPIGPGVRACLGQHGETLFELTDELCTAMIAEFSTSFVRRPAKPSIAPPSSTSRAVKRSADGD